MFPARNPINFLKDQETLDHEKCTICFSINIDVFRCAGPCKKIFCIDCVDRFASNRYVCTFCNDDKPFTWNAVNKRSLTFQCPYEPSHASFPCVQEFIQHCYECPLINGEDKISRQHIINYQCKEGHRLIFLTEQAAHRVFKSRSIFNALTHSECEICKEVTLCRSYCPKCSINKKDPILYCVKCRFPPCTKTHCPIGHQLRLKNYRSMSSICDFCGYSDRFSTEFSFTDSACNFDICHRCYLKLHHENKLQPLRNQFVMQKQPSSPTYCQIDQID